MNHGTLKTAIEQRSSDVGTTSHTIFAVNSRGIDLFINVLGARNRVPVGGNPNVGVLKLNRPYRPLLAYQERDS